VGAWASASSFEHDLLVRERDLVRARSIVRELLSTPTRFDARVRARRAAPVVNRIVRG
jgi:hypothetical protein